MPQTHPGTCIMLRALDKQMTVLWTSRVPHTHPGMLLRASGNQMTVLWTSRVPRTWHLHHAESFRQADDCFVD